MSDQAIRNLLSQAQQVSHMLYSAIQTRPYPFPNASDYITRLGHPDTTPQIGILLQALMSLFRDK